MDTVKQVAERHGQTTAIAWADHKIEALEADLRSKLQALRALSDAVLDGDPRARGLAQAVRDLLNTREGR